MQGGWHAGAMRDAVSWRRPLSALVALVVLALSTGCVGEPPSIDPSGVDGLQIPTVSPDPHDFVATVDNPWFPLAPGTVWTYRSDEATLTVTASAETRVVAGVATRVVGTVLTDEAGRVLRDAERFYAQDDVGNVWAFGELVSSTGGPGTDTSWQAGEDGAQAALAMPATPRLGDGYRMAYRPGVVEDTAQITRLDARRTVEAGSFEGLVELEVTSPLDPGLVTREYYAEGLGLVGSTTLSGTEPELELVGVATG